VPLGVVLGYGLTAVFDSEFNHWQYSYYLQAITYFFVFLIFTCIPTKYIEEQVVEEEKNTTGKEIHLAEIPPSSGNAINEVDEDDEGYLSYDESIDAGYRGENSSKVESSF
jgi:hypothetical protein